MEDVDPEKQKPLPFHFQTPCLELTKDESKARIRWQAKSSVVAHHRQYMVNSVSKENHTSLYSLWMPSAEAKWKHVVLLAELRQGTTWLNMYQTTAKICEPERPLPHNFAMPMVDLFSSDKTLARIHWQQRGAIVTQHAMHLKQYNGKEADKTSLYSLWMPRAKAKRKHEALLAELRQGTSWLNMYQTTAKECEPEKPLPHNFAMPNVERHPCPLLPMDASKLFIRGLWLHLGHHKVVRQRLLWFTNIGHGLIHVQPRGALPKLYQ